MSNAETKTASKSENGIDVPDLKAEVQELTVADAEHVRGGQAILLQAKPVKIEF